jgi:hypothetical protein
VRSLLKAIWRPLAAALAEGESGHYPPRWFVGPHVELLTAALAGVAFYCDSRTVRRNSRVADPCIRGGRRQHLTFTISVCPKYLVTCLAA